MESVHDVVKKIVGIEVPIEIVPDLKTWGEFWWVQETGLKGIRLRYAPFHTLNCYTAAHEAYHCKRFLEKKCFYFLDLKINHYIADSILLAEETIVNNLALAFCLHNFPEYAENFEAIYNTLMYTSDSQDKMDKEKFSKGYCVQIHNENVRRLLNVKS